MESLDDHLYSWFPARNVGWLLMTQLNLWITLWKIRMKMARWPMELCMTIERALKYAWMTFEIAGWHSRMVGWPVWNQLIRSKSTATDCGHSAQSFCWIILLKHFAQTFCSNILLKHSAQTFCSNILLYCTVPGLCDIATSISANLSCTSLYFLGPDQ